LAQVMPVTGRVSSTDCSLNLGLPAVEAAS
jgi:hypothetical protein